jgi:hypothetical protein
MGISEIKQGAFMPQSLVARYRQFDSLIGKSINVKTLDEADQISTCVETNDVEDAKARIKAFAIANKREVYAMSTELTKDGKKSFVNVSLLHLGMVKL